MPSEIPPTPRSGGASFVRGYFRLLKFYLLSILLLMSGLLLTLALYDAFDPSARIYERVFIRQPLAKAISPK